MKNYRLSECPFGKRPLLFLFVAFCFMFSVSTCDAATITLNGSSSWDLGIKGGLIETHTISDFWNVTVDSGYVLVSVNPSGIWTASTDGTQSVIDKFVLRRTTSSGQIITETNQGFGISGTTFFGLSFTTPKAGSEQGAHTLTVALTATPDWSCGNDLVVAHTAADGVAPVDKTVTYGTVLSSLTGASKCWITQNLGATNQATSADDATEPSAGWYWQFNRKQGFKHDGTTRTPSTWDATTDDSSATWESAKDPCTLLLGSGWRLPTYTEYLNADAAPQSWANYNDTYASVLKLHAAGALDDSTGALYGRGSNGYYWSSTQDSSTNGYYLNFSSSYSDMNNGNKANGFGVRCLKD